MVARFDERGSMAVAWFRGFDGAQANANRIGSPVAPLVVTRTQNNYVQPKRYTELERDPL